MKLETKLFTFLNLFATTAIVVVMIIVTMSSVQAKETDSDTPAFEPTSNYMLLDVEGWSVRVNGRLTEPSSELGQKALRLLRLQLYQISVLVPEPALIKLQKIGIWLDDDRRNRIHYHLERQWLVEHGLNSDRAKCVDIGRADQFINVYRSQPFVLLHELAHAFHDQILGFDDQRVKEAFQHATDAKTYENVLLFSGKTVRHYAMTNHKEYFAECTEAFFGTNDFYPFVRAELKVHDPTMFRLLDSIWQAQSDKSTNVNPGAERINAVTTNDSPRAKREFTER